MLSLIFFFFKQKTAYEMRISDLSSDVCSSDLFRLFAVDLHLGMKPAPQKFGVAEIPVAEKSAGLRKVDYLATAARDVGRRLNKTDTFGLTVESDRKSVV